MTQAYPLHWPDHVERARYRKEAQFRCSMGKARDDVVAEIDRLGGRYPVISTNIPLRQDGLPYAKYRTPQDCGVAVYFEYKGKQVCFACDKWQKIEHNLRAVGLTINAIRGIARWGSTDMLDRAVNAFEALPSPSDENRPHWTKVLGVGRDASEAEIMAMYRVRATQVHPDMGGTQDEMATLNAAKDQALEEVRQR